MHKKGKFLIKMVSSKEVMIFTRQFSAMIKAGVPIVRALEILVEQTTNKSFRNILREILEAIEGGKSFTDALSLHKEVFGALYISMARAGEVSGKLDETMTRVAEHLEKTEALKGKIKSALAYPTVIFIVAIGATFFLLTKIIPTFARLFEGFGAQLPGLTKFVINLSYFVTHNILLLFLLLVAIVILIRFYSRTSKGRLQFDAMKLNLPIVGVLVRKTAVARFARTLATLTDAGVPILTGLEITATTSGNKIIENALIKAKESITGGKSIFQPLKESGAFPPIVTNLVRIGEESGKLSEMLSKLADFYETEVDAAISTLTSLIEPLTIVFLGGVIGVLLAAMYLPMFQLATIVK